jgi:hypothetical protein
MSHIHTANAPVTSFSWSYSQLTNFETCPKRYYHYNVAKDVKDEENEYTRHGNAVHAAFNARLSDGTALPLGMGQYESMLARFADAPGKTYSEQKLAITSDFKPVAFFGRGVWCRTIIDAAKVRDDGSAVIADWKTGKVNANPTQLELMSAVMFAQDPRLTRIKASLIFINHEHTTKLSFERAGVTNIWAKLLPRVRKVIDARQANEYPPQPCGLCKRYCAVVSCPYHGQ